MWKGNSFQISQVRSKFGFVITFIFFKNQDFYGNFKKNPYIKHNAGIKRIKKNTSGKFLLYKEKVNRLIILEKHSFFVVHVRDFTYLYYYIMQITIELWQPKMSYYQET